MLNRIPASIFSNWVKHFFRGLRAFYVLIRLNSKVKFHPAKSARVKLFGKIPAARLRRTLCEKQSDLKPMAFFPPRVENCDSVHTYVSPAVYFAIFSFALRLASFPALLFFFRIVFIYLSLCTTGYSAAPRPLFNCWSSALPYPLPPLYTWVSPALSLPLSPLPPLPLSLFL